LLGTAAVGAGVYKNLGSPNMSWLSNWGSNPIDSFGNADANAVLNPYFTVG
jgi:hypothetical protein